MAACAACGFEAPETAKFCPECGAALVQPARPEGRRIVTVLFADVVRSTALGETLDAESLRAVIARWHDACRAAIERHGGTLEKFAGDAAMAVFGIPALHEDDALRAVRAAADMQASLAALNDDLERDYGLRLETRTGLNTGEVVTGRGETLVTGDAVNVAARLEQAAGPGEILLGRQTFLLVRRAVEVELLPPLEARGKAEPVTAYRLGRVRGEAEGFARRLDSPLVGRRAELAVLRQAFERAERERRCHLVTLLGPAGIGKSRLVQELTAELEGRAGVVRGRCLAYGDGITWGPLLEIVRGLGGEEALGGLLAGASNGELVVAGLRQALGRDVAAGGEEIFWAVRTLLEALARERPLVCVLDDLHWAQPTFLDLVEHVADLSRGAPILLVCSARPELLEIRPAWGGGKVNATTLLLEPLSDEEARELTDRLLERSALPSGLRSRILAAAEGNPLFVEQTLALLEEGEALGDETAVPPTIQALVAARVDRLDPGERAVLETASVIGKEFQRDIVEELAPPHSDVPGALRALVRRELIVPTESLVPGHETYRFRSLLIRDAAYAAISKDRRAELHERLARRLEQLGRAAEQELEELVGYHLEQSFLLRRELGPADDATARLGAEAGGRLLATGERAHERGDVPAAANLLARALVVLPDTDARRTDASVALAEAQQSQGRLDDAERTIASLRIGADRRATAWADTLAAYARVFRSDPRLDTLDAELERLERTFGALGDDLGLSSIWHLRHLRSWLLLRAEECRVSLEHAIELAERAGAERTRRGLLSDLMGVLVVGPLPVPEALRSVEAAAARAGPGRLTEAQRKNAIGALESYRGRFAEARALTTGARAILDELGQTFALASWEQIAGNIALLSGDAAGAERALRGGCEALERMGERAYLSSMAARLARALLALGRDDEAERYARVSEESADANDVDAQTMWRSVLALSLARRGEHEDAERLARDAASRLADSDFLVNRGIVLLDLAEVLRLGGRLGEAAAAAHEARAKFVAKEASTYVSRADALLGELAAEPLPERR